MAARSSRSKVDETQSRVKGGGVGGLNARKKELTVKGPHQRSARGIIIPGGVITLDICRSVR